MLAVVNEDSPRHQYPHAKRSAVSPQYRAATTSVSFLRTRGDSLFLAPQNLYEFWAVATRPLAENGLGMTVEATTERLKELKRSFILLQDTPSLFTTWESLVGRAPRRVKLLMTRASWEQ